MAALATSPDAGPEIARELQANCERPFDDARAMPPRVYTSEAFLALEQLDGQPVVVLRDELGDLRGLSNVCLHRMSVLLEGRGNVRRIVCPYHAWNYTLDGTLAGAPMMERQAGFCKESYHLPSIRCETWQGWIYVTLNPDAPSVATQLEELTQLIEPYGMSGYIETFYEEHVWDTNWKILAENFMESYHLPMLHRATVGPHSRLEEMECPPGRAAFNYHWITKEASLPIGNAHPGNTRLQGHWRRTTALLAIYPTHLVTLTPGYFWYLVLQPRGVGQVHIQFGGGLSPEFIDDPQAADYMATLKTLLDAVNAEDRRGVEAVFRGVHAPLAKPGNLSHLERPNYDFARYLAQRTATS
jgi:choline monooxygenase